jgi:hypothetical protein
VYYCQACDDPHLMEPDDGVARCPACGNVDPHAVMRPLFVVTGASGSGKTTIFPELLSRMAGWCAVFDVDWLIDPLARAAKDGQIDWPAFTDTWLHVAHGLAQNGLPTLLLAPFIPANLDNLPGRAWVGDIHYLVLDCPTTSVGGAWRPGRAGGAGTSTRRPGSAGGCAEISRRSSTPPCNRRPTSRTR